MTQPQAIDVAHIEIDNVIVPQNFTGKPLDIAYSITLANESMAELFFKRTLVRLLTIENWHTLAGVASASFTLVDSQGSPLERAPQSKDYIKIDIPGPGSTTGDGFDWVMIEDIKKDYIVDVAASFGMRLRACANPLHEGTGTAHFFGHHATSNFVITLKDATVNAFYHGRNEKPNVENVPLMDKLRNTFVASGAMVGLSNLQWSALLKGLLSEK